MPDDESVQPQQVPSLTRDELETLLQDELATLAEDVVPTYERYRISPIRMERRWELAGRKVSAPVWVVARDGPTVLGYDDVEEEWGIGRASEDPAAGAVVEDWGTFGARLQWTLLHFPNGPAHNA